MTLQLTLREIFTYGGAFIVTGAALTTITVNRQSIARLWKLKQDKDVCTPTHESITKALEEIKDDVKWLRDRKENGK